MSDNDLARLLAALPSIRARIEAIDHSFIDSSHQPTADELLHQLVASANDTHELLALVDALIAEREHLVVTAEDMEYLRPIRHTERLHSVVTYLARMDNPLMVDEIFSEDEPLIEQLLAQGRIEQRCEPHGEPYYVPAAKAGDE